MVYKLNNTEIRRLGKSLLENGRDPFKYNFTSALLSILQGAAPADVYVDLWPNFTIVVAVINFPKCYMTCLLYAESIDSATEVVDKTLPWGQDFQIVSSKYTRKLILQTAERNCIKSEAEMLPLNLVTRTELSRHVDCESLLPQGFTLGSLNAHDHTDLVAHYWEVQNRPPKTIGRVNFTLRHYQNAAIFNDKKEPVCWNIQQFYGGAGMGYTLPEYRSLNFMNIVSQRLMQLMRNQGYEYYTGFIVADNSAQIRSQEKAGGKVYKDDPVVIIRFLGRGAKL